MRRMRWPAEKIATKQALAADSRMNRFGQWLQVPAPKSEFESARGLFADLTPNQRNRRRRIDARSVLLHEHPAVRREKKDCAGMRKVRVIDPLKLDAESDRQFKDRIIAARE